MRLPEFKFFKEHLYSIAVVLGSLAAAVLILLGVNALANIPERESPNISSDVSDAALADEMNKVSAETKKAG